MMVADTSAFIAIVTNEIEREAFESVMAQDGDVLMSTASAVEFLIVAYARGDAVYQNALRILDQPLVTLIPRSHWTKSRCTPPSRIKPTVEATTPPD